MEETRAQTTDILHAKSETPHRMELYQNEEKCFLKKDYKSETYFKDC